MSRIQRWGHGRQATVTLALSDDAEVEATRRPEGGWQASYGRWQAAGRTLSDAVARLERQLAEEDERADAGFWASPDCP